MSTLPTCSLHPRWPFFSLTHSSLVSSLSPRFWVCWLLTHRLWTILVSRRHFLPLHELLNAQALAIRILLTAVHSHTENFPPVSHFHAQEFPGFYPRRFLCGLVNGVAESFPHGSNCGFYIDYYPHPGWEYVNWFPTWSV